MKFTELVAQDVEKAFLNPEEFGELHLVNGLEMLIIMDGNEMIEREKRVKNHAEGTFRKQILFFVAAEEFGALPAIGREISGMTGMPVFCGESPHRRSYRRTL